MLRYPKTQYVVDNRNEIFLNDVERGLKQSITITDIFRNSLELNNLTAMANNMYDTIMPMMLSKASIAETVRSPKYAHHMSFFHV